MSIFSSYKKIFLLGFIVVILIAIPFYVYVAQQRQRTKSQAAASTTLLFDPASPTIKVDDILTLNVVLDPGSGALANQVSFVKLSISFDPTKFTTVSGSLAPNITSSAPPQNTLTSVLEDPVYTSTTASISLSIGADPTKVVTTKTKIAVLKLKALSTTEVNSPSLIKFDLGATQILSIASLDQTSENVLNLVSTTVPATVTITSALVSTSSTPTPTSGPTPTAGGPTLTPTPTSGPAPTAGGPTLTPTPTTADVPTPTPTVQPLPTPTPIVILAQEPLPPTGPGEKILGIGILGAIFTIIGGALFILL